MNTHQARWISKQRRDELKRRTGLRDIILIDSMHGFILVEPKDSNLGDGDPLSLDDADQELRTVWCQDRKAKLIQARNLLGLPAEEAPAFASAR
jgi:hypothetical protein